MKKLIKSEGFIFFALLSIAMLYAWLRVDSHYDKALKGTKLQQQRHAIP